MKIYGAGMAGLLAAHMLRRHSPVVMEAQESLPNNHEAVLRFRSDAVSRATAIPFKKVKVTKGIISGGLQVTPSIALSNQYSLKVTGRVVDRSILSLEPSERFIAPPNFIEQLAQGIDIKYGEDARMTEDTFHDGVLGELDGQPFISTVPLPAVLGLLSEGWLAPQFSSREIWTITADIISPTTEVYQTFYYPGQSTPVYRASITGSRLIIEMVATPIEPMHIIENTLAHFGMNYNRTKIHPNFKTTHAKFGKIIPIDDDWRKQALYELTSRYGMYSLGRFACWRQILLDDVVQDIERIDRWISSGSDYNRRIASAD